MKKRYIVLGIIAFFFIVGWSGTGWKGGGTDYGDQDIINVGDIALDSLSSDSGTTITVTPGTTLVVNGGQSCKKTNVADAAYGTSAITSDYIVAWTSISAARAAVISTEDEDSGTATLPRVMVFKDQTGSTASYNITISLESGGSIDGAATYILNKPYQFVVLEIDGTNAWTIGGN